MAAGPGISMAIYLTITTLYFLIKMFVKSIDGMALTISYFCLVILGQFFINIDITNSTCGEPNFGVAALASTIPWILILGSITVFLAVYPGWLIPFSNTIGYVVASAAGVGALFNEILVPEMQAESGKTYGDVSRSADEIASAERGKGAALKTLEMIYNDKSLLVNEISKENLPKFWENMKRANIIEKSAGEVNMSLYDKNLNPEDYDGDNFKNFTKLFDFIRMKDLVSEYLWFALTGTLVCSMAYNYIQNVGCYKSVEEMKKTHDDYLKQEQEIQDKKDEAANEPKTTYKTYE
jgi:hypothetical protein